MADSSKFHVLYGPWLYGQVKSIYDQAQQRKSEIPPDHSADVQHALSQLETALSKLRHHAK